MTSLRERFHQARTRLNQAERQVLDAILVEFDTAANNTVSDLAKKAHTSEASVVRACKSLGFSGYHSLRLAIAEENGRVRRGRADSEEINDARGETSSNIKHYIELLETLGATLPTQLLQDVGDVWMEADTILFTACGNSIPPALDACYRLSRLGMRAVFPTDTVAQASFAQTLGNRSVVVAFSESGTSIPVIETLKIARKNDCKIVVFTSTSRSPMAGMGGLQVIIPSERQGLDLLVADALGSRVLYMVVVSAIIDSMLTRYSNRFIEYIRSSTLNISGVGRKL